MKRSRLWAVISMWAVAAGALQAGDLRMALAEKDLGRRSKLALDNAGSTLKSARAALDKGENEKLTADVAEVQDSVDLAYDSLKSTGKDPRRNPKWFKQAEIQTRDLLRKVESLQNDMNFQDRPLMDKLKARLLQVHEDLLLGLMEGRKKK